MRQRMATDKRYPILPRSKDKPAGGGPVIAAYEAEAKRRIDGLKADIAAIVDAIPAYKANKVTVTVTPEMLGEYYYALDSQRIADIAVSIQSAIDKWYGSESADKPWSASHVTAGYEYGAGQAYANLSGLSDAYLMSTTVESIMATPAVVQAIAVAHMQSYEAWNGFSADMRRDLANVIGQGIAQGLNPRIVAEQIAERFAIAESRAMSIAQTEVLGAVQTPVSVSGFPVTVGDVLSYNISGLEADSTYYYTITPVGNNVVASNRIELHTMLQSGVETPQNNKLSYIVLADGVMLRQLQSGSYVVLSDITGKRLQTIQPKGADVLIKLSKRGIYLLQVQQNEELKTIKVLY